MPVRVQRKRTKGWKMPPNTVAVTRPMEWGNPFKVGGWFMMGGGWTYCQASEGYQDEQFTLIETREQAVNWYRRYLDSMPGKVAKAKRDLKGKNLACFCALDQPCHADVLLEIANAD